MRRLLIIMLAFVMSFTVAFANGDGNIDGGGDDMGDGDKTNNWFVGDDGVRITIIKENNNSVVAGPLDFSNKDTSSVEMYFLPKSKIQYSNGVIPALGVSKKVF